MANTRRAGPEVAGAPGVVRLPAPSPTHPAGRQRVAARHHHRRPPRRRRAAPRRRSKAAAGASRRAAEVPQRVVDVIRRGERDATREAHRRDPGLDLLDAPKSHAPILPHGERARASSTASPSAAAPPSNTWNKGCRRRARGANGWRMALYGPMGGGGDAAAGAHARSARSRSNGWRRERGGLGLSGPTPCLCLGPAPAPAPRARPRSRSTQLRLREPRLAGGADDGGLGLTKRSAGLTKRVRWPEAGGSRGAHEASGSTSSAGYASF